MGDGRREARAVDGGGDAVGPGEAGGERADALQADAEADVGDRAVGHAQQRGGALEPAGQQVLVRRLAERAAELAAEVRAREAGGAGHVVDVERLEEARVGEVASAEQVAGGRRVGHVRACPAVRASSALAAGSPSARRSWVPRPSTRSPSRTSTSKRSLRPVGDLEQARRRGALRALAGARDVLDADLEADRRAAVGEVLGGEPRGGALHHRDHARRREHAGRERAADVGQQPVRDGEGLGALGEAHTTDDTGGQQ